MSSTFVFKLLILVSVVKLLFWTLVSKLSCSVLLSVTFFSNLLKSVFSTRSFATLLVNLLKSVGTVLNFGISNLSTSV